MKYRNDAAKRRDLNRTLMDQAFYGFIAMDEAGQREFAEYLNAHFAALGHSKAIRWTLKTDK